MKGLSAALCTVVLSCVQVPAQETIYFLAVAPKVERVTQSYEATDYASFVVPVSEPTSVTAIRDRIRRGELTVVTLQIAATASSVNKDYYADGLPAWNWSVIRLISVDGEPVSSTTPNERSYGTPTLIAADPGGFIARNGDTINFQTSTITTEVDPSASPTPLDPSRVPLANLSTRGVAGEGQSTFIQGTVVLGTKPRQVAIRAIGGARRR